MLGLPKGSLEESTKALFAKAGWKITTSSRSYRPSIDDAELDGRFVRAQEVSRYVEHGFFDCGLTGHDWVLENKAGQIAPQGWEFYAITATLFMTLAFPGFVYRYLFKRHE